MGIGTIPATPNTAAQLNASPSIPPHIFKSQIRFLIKLNVTPNTVAVFSNPPFLRVPKAAVLRGVEWERTLSLEALRYVLFYSSSKLDLLTILIL